MSLPFSGRIEGPAKVAGTAIYEGDVMPPGMLHAALVEAPIAHGRLSAINDAAAGASPGFVALITRREAASLRSAAYTALIRTDEVHFAGQAVGLVVGKTNLDAAHAARLVVPTFEVRAPVTSLRHSDAAIYAPDMCGARAPAAISRGDVATALARAPHVVSRRYETAANNHHPMEPCVVVCWWEDGKAVVHTSTQAVFGTRTVIANAFGLPHEDVRVLSRLLGGGFGCKGTLWFPWLLWTLIAAQQTNRPVRLELTRSQMSTLVGRRSATVQDLTLAADDEGRLLAIDHQVLAQTSTHAEYADPVGMVSQWVYRCANVSTAHRLAPTNEPHAIPMRGPGEAPGSFALESGLNELAEQLQLDPVELRLRNIAECDQVTGLPWSSNSLAKCLQQGAASFAWKEHPNRGWREGDLQVGIGVGVASYPARRQPCALRLRLASTGRLTVECGTQDMGSGTITTIAQMAAEALTLPIDMIDVVIGDTWLPQGPISAGSQVTQSFAPAITTAARELRAGLAALLPDGVTPETVLLTADGMIRRRGSNEAWPLSERFVTANLAYLEGAAAEPGQPAEPVATGMGFGAVFAEVAVDSCTAMLRVRRMTAAFAAGRIVNPTLARSQYISGLVGGIGMALHEETLTDLRSGRIVGPGFGDYLVPTQADMPHFDIIIVEEVDEYLPEGIKGVGMLGHVGSAAAIADAVYAATGTRVRHLPIKVEDIL